MRSVAVAIAFLTRLPTPASWELTAADVGRAARWFPLIGALIGAVYSLVHVCLLPYLSPLLIAVLIVGIEVWLTGALHLDGLADMADGFGGGRSREDVLRIMHDHAIGTYGGLALILIVLLKAGAIAGLIERHIAAPYLVVAPLLGRWSTVLLNYLMPYARETDREDRKPGGTVTDFVGWRELLIASLISLAVAIPLLAWRAMACGLITLLVSALVAWFCWKRIRGVTGDTLGANVELCEAALLLAGLLLA